ncbi:MAG TPA: hypothetical protein DCX67_09175, partial [Opitutae bacterium]|nr:hypothetical protein [Opitutae bacterium]
GSGGGHAATGTGNSGGGGGAISFLVAGDFRLEGNGSISASGGKGQLDSDSSGAGGSGGAIRIQAANIYNSGRILAQGGDSFGLGGVGGGGRIALVTAGALVEGDLNASSGRSLYAAASVHRSADLVGHWKFDENASVSVATDSSGNNLHATIVGSPQRLPGVRDGAFYFDGNDDRAFVPYDSKLALNAYTVSLWVYPERNNEGWTGIFGRGNAGAGNTRNYAVFLGNSSHVDSPFIHHRFTEGSNWSDGPPNHSLTGWNQWYHVVCSNGGIGSVARTFVNGTFFEGNLIREKPILEDLVINTSSPLNFGVDPDSVTSDNLFFLGRMDDVRLYDVPLGIEDVKIIHLGETSLDGMRTTGTDGSILRVTVPTLPALPDISLTYGQEILSADLGEHPGITYSVSGLPPGLSNRKTFTPPDLPGLLSWYASDRNGSFAFHADRAYDRNDTVATSDLILGLAFEEGNGSVALDSTGNGNHAKVLSSTQWTTGKSGGGISFDGDNDGVYFPKLSYMNQPSEFTLSLWFNRATDKVGMSTNNGV